MSRHSRIDKSEVEKVYIKHTVEHHSATPNNRLGDLPHGSKGFRFGYSQRKCRKTECFQCNLLQVIYGDFGGGLGTLKLGDAALNIGILMFALKSAHFFKIHWSPLFMKSNDILNLKWNCQWCFFFFLMVQLSCE